MSAQAIEGEVVELKQPAALVPLTAITPMAMLSQAIERGAGIEVLTKLMDLQERYERNLARKAFDEAMAKAKSEIPVIIKNRQVGFDSNKPGAKRTEYRHEDLAQIARTIDPILSKHGLSYRFRTSSAANEPVTVTCIVSHRLGYSEENTLSAGRDDTGGKNVIQSVGSTLTYLQRYALKAALGLAAANDDDGAKSDDTAEDEQQAADSRTLILNETADLDETELARFLKALGVEALTDIPAREHKRALAMLAAHRARKAAAQ